MEYRRMNSAVVLRVDPDEDIVQAVLDVCSRENIQGALISGIGACKEVEMGVFDPRTRVYTSRTYRGVYEIVSLGGTAGMMDDAPYVHLHIAVADGSNTVIGGHLNSCIVSATGELVLQLLEEPVNRKYSEAIGLNLIEF